jgi:hypothetical protein
MAPSLLKTVHAVHSKGKRSTPLHKESQNQLWAIRINGYKAPKSQNTHSRKLASDLTKQDSLSNNQYAPYGCHGAWLADN